MLTIKELTDGLYSTVEDLYNTLEAEKARLELNEAMCEEMKRFFSCEDAYKEAKAQVKKQRATIRKLQKWYDITKNYAIMDC
jgi:hypothetical protein